MLKILCTVNCYKMDSTHSLFFGICLKNHLSTILSSLKDVKKSSLKIITVRNKCVNVNLHAYHVTCRRIVENFYDPES